MDINEFSRWGWLIVLALNLVGGWGMWSLHRKFVTRDDCVTSSEKIRKRQSDMENALYEAKVRNDAFIERLSHLPSSKDFHNLTVVVERFGGDLRALGSKMDGQAGLMSRIEKTVDILNEVHMGERR